jgi:hypothetical protein
MHFLWLLLVQIATNTQEIGRNHRCASIFLTPFGIILILQKVNYYYEFRILPINQASVQFRWGTEISSNQLHDVHVLVSIHHLHFSPRWKSAAWVCVTTTEKTQTVGTVLMTMEPHSSDMYPSCTHTQKSAHIRGPDSGRQGKGGRRRRGGDDDLPVRWRPRRGAGE